MIGGEIFVVILPFINLPLNLSQLQLQIVKVSKLISPERLSFQIKHVERKNHPQFFAPLQERHKGANGQSYLKFSAILDRDDLMTKFSNNTYQTEAGITSEKIL